MDLNNSCDTFTENEEQLVLVDIRDKPQGFSGKIDVHRQALLHPGQLHEILRVL
tara:strand:+ start:594 stop:755 length:162 start_codon:yes stop_codon:yes gene_type:complete